MTRFPSNFRITVLAMAAALVLTTAAPALVPVAHAAGANSPGSPSTTGAKSFFLGAACGFSVGLAIASMGATAGEAFIVCCFALADDERD